MQHRKQQITVLITAGHAATTALATIEELKDDPTIEWDIHWIGPKKSIEGTQFPPFELSLFPQLGVTVHSISAGKLQSKFTRHTIPALLKVPLGFFQAIILLFSIRPKVILSFGGFAALPVVFASWVLYIPSVLHEQTMAAGLANQISSYFVTKIALARVESKQFFSRRKGISGKCVVTGNPLTREILATRGITKLSSRPTLFVTGGSRGAQRINIQIFAVLEELLKEYHVIHHTGQLDYSKANVIKDKLSNKIKNEYEIYSFINPLEISNVYSKSSIIIARAGANTVSEILYLHIPTIFIPIPWTRADEQTKNALFAQERGVGLLLPESKLSAENLLRSIREVRTHWLSMKKNSMHNSHLSDNQAAVRLVNLLKKQIS